MLHETTTDSLILTQRSFALPHHPGEVCFPGGRWQPTDEDYFATALRELQEELGVSPERILSPSPLESELTLTGFVIHPWFAKITTLEPFKMDEGEVAAVLRVAVPDVINRRNYHRVEVSRNGFTIQTIQYQGDDFTVWGATARIMLHLSEATARGKFF